VSGSLAFRGRAHFPDTVLIDKGGGLNASPFFKLFEMDQPILYTSYFAMHDKIVKQGIIPVAISRYIQPWLNGKVVHYLTLAPASDMIKRPVIPADFIPRYRVILKKASSKVVVGDLKKISVHYGGKPLALMCYEKPSNFCHRHLVKDWLHRNGYQIAEWNKSLHGIAGTQ